MIDYLFVEDIVSSIMSEIDPRRDLKSKITSSLTSISLNVGVILWGVDYGFYGNGKLV